MLALGRRHRIFLVRYATASARPRRGSGNYLWGACGACAAVDVVMVLPLSAGFPTPIFRTSPEVSFSHREAHASTHWGVCACTTPSSIGPDQGQRCQLFKSIPSWMCDIRRRNSSVVGSRRVPRSSGVQRVLDRPRR
ncbi:hypothetical protein C8J57DRAFT_1351925 [Mycena rebaudengoi]|nr:hypothetical protein C8J57DRAFT_1351925 [Mycena rebaudengoi]